MNIDIKGVHFEITEKTKDFIDKKLQKIEHAKDLLVDLLFTLTKQTKGGYSIEATMNFRWGYSTHISVDSFDLYEGIDKLFDKMVQKINKEKEKIQGH